MVIWISVKDKLPEHEQEDVIIHSKGRIWYETMYTDYEEDDEPSFYHEDTDSIIKLSEVSHWMPGIKMPIEPID